MGVTFDVILAEDNEVDRLGAFVPLPPADIISTKILDPVTFAKLHAAITQSDFEEAYKCYHDPIFEGGTDGPWIYEVPSEFTSTLSLLDDIGFKCVVHDWANTEEIQVWKVLDQLWIQELVKDIQSLARRANHLKKKLFLRATL